MSILPLLLHVKTFSQGFMSTKDPGSRRSLIYIELRYRKTEHNFQGIIQTVSHQDVNRERKTKMNPKRSRNRTKTNRMEKHASALAPNDGSTEEAPASRVVARSGQRLGRRGRFRALDPQTLGGDLEVSETGCKRGVSVGV
jgi:hypothetical protein